VCKEEAVADVASGADETAAGPLPEYAIEVRGLQTGYLKRPVVHEITFRCQTGEVTCLFGHNGAGKSSTLKAIAGLLPQYSGEVRLFGEDVSALPISARVRKGVVYLPQERAVFPGLTVEDNLLLGAALERDRSAVAARREMVIDLFPRLGERLGQLAQTMSGGEQRMLSMGIALMAGARALMLDEPSLGLAPQVNLALLQVAQRLCKEQGVSVLLVEQAIGEALAFADRVFVVRSGTIVAEHTGDEARVREDWWTVF
jgi:branched-chain amino acid transport system ATP-binding protein